LLACLLHALTTIGTGGTITAPLPPQGAPQRRTCPAKPPWAAAAPTLTGKRRPAGPRGRRRQSRPASVGRRSRTCLPASRWNASGAGALRGGRWLCCRGRLACKAGKGWLRQYAVVPICSEGPAAISSGKDAHRLPRRWCTNNANLKCRLAGMKRQQTPCQYKSRTTSAPGSSTMIPAGLIMPQTPPGWACSKPCPR
jgi:hypothetical protein